MSAAHETRPRIPDADFNAFVAHARDRHLISEIIGRYTDLKKRGARELVGLCCFHNERSPSLEVNDDKGTYHCFGCGEAGDAISFLIKREGLSFIDAVETLAGDTFPAISDDERAKRKADNERKQAERLAIAREIWVSGGPTKGSPAEVYARSRGITIDLPRTIRFGMVPRWRDPETGEVGRSYPAMICAIQDVDGKMAGVQCVYLQDGGRSKYSRPNREGKPAKAKLTFGLLVGGAFRLGPVAETIICCEGPEDGLTLAQALPGQSVWVSCGTAGLGKIKFPDTVKSIVLAGDNNPSGRKAAAEAHTIYAARGLAVQEMFPDDPFKDWNDCLLGVVK